MTNANAVVTLGQNVQKVIIDLKIKAAMYEIIAG